VREREVLLGGVREKGVQRPDEIPVWGFGLGWARLRGVSLKGGGKQRMEYGKW